VHPVTREAARRIIAGMGALIVIVLLVIVGYLISLSRHPRGRRCRRCKGTGIQKGLIFRYSHRNCTRCGGGGGRARIGLRILKPGPVWGERAPQEAAARRTLGR
jgi:hypothetical protein